jgi:hypothetical protein
VTYLQNWVGFFHPDRLDLVEQADQMAVCLGGRLTRPRLSWKALWITVLLGWQRARRVHAALRRMKWSLIRFWDRTLFQIEGRKFRKSNTWRCPAPEGTGHQSSLLDGIGKV